MKNRTLLIKDCRLVNNGKAIRTNILIEGDKIAHIGNFRSADQIIDAKNNFVIPGVIDSHVHFRIPGAEEKEDWLSGTKAAAAGGVTTVLDMPNTNPSTTNNEELDKKRTYAREKYINFGFHVGATTDNAEDLKNTKNIASVKVYMGSSTGNLLIDDIKILTEIFETAAKQDLLVMVHAEDEQLIKHNTEQYGDHWDVHCLVRHNLCAARAVEKAITVAAKTNCKLHIAHISTKEELELIRSAKQSGLPITCEATMNHLMLNDEKHDNFTKVNPPLRSEEDRLALWEAIYDGTIDTIGTDHAPHTIDNKQSSMPPSGIPGVETILPILLDLMDKKLLSLSDIVRLTSANPARLFGIKNKGKIAVGYDADLTIIDLKREKQVNAGLMHSKARWSPFHGWMLKGWPTTTIVNGQMVWHNEKFYQNSGREVLFE